jgi:hypothetical protein
MDAEYILDEIERAKNELDTASFCVSSDTSTRNRFLISARDRLNILLEKIEREEDAPPP